MARKKALILGSSLLIAGSSLAGQSNCDLFKTTDLGTTQDVKESILDINNVEDYTLNASPLELCCAYGDPRDFKKNRRKNKRDYRKYKRQEKRKK